MSNGNQDNLLSEQQWQYINSVYNYARGIGIDILRNFLPVVIIFVGLPAIFYEKMSNLLTGSCVALLFIAWVGIIISVGLGFISFFLVFEGYFNFAHSELHRMINNRDQMRNFENVSNTRFDRARGIGIACLATFILGLVFLILFIASALF